jgi:flavin reductase (DIM6/NTAB) family NADH-FMN oxidoreductase RutF
VHPDKLRDAARKFASGVTVATAAHAGLIYAMTATAFSTLSMDPPLVLLGVKNSGKLLELARRAQHFGVSVLNDGQHAIGQWAAISGRVPERDLTISETIRARTGAPLLAGSAAWFDCELRSLAEHGDHTVLVGLVVDAWADAPAQPLIYFEGGYHALGKRLAEGGVTDIKVL